MLAVILLIIVLGVAAGVVWIAITHRPKKCLVTPKSLTSNQKEVFVWHAPRHEYMYAAFRTTVLEGLQGIGVKKIHTSFDGDYDWDMIPRGSIFICLGKGIKFASRVPWEALKAAGCHSLL